MKRLLTMVIVLIVIGSSIYSLVFADHPEEKGAKERTSLVLSTKLQRLLSAEMNSVQNGMTNLAMAIPSGDWTSITENADSISNGYILNKKLSAQEIEEFTNLLPEDYKKFELDFKKMAKDMTDAANKRDADKVNLLFYKLNSTCIQCHIRYAESRFPAFK